MAQQGSQAAPEQVCVYLQLGSTAIGVLTKEGVVLAVEKRITSPLLVGCGGFCLRPVLHLLEGM